MKPDSNGNGPTPVDPGTGKPVDQPKPQTPKKPEPSKPEDKEKQLEDASKGDGDDNPKKETPKNCKTPDCQSEIIGEYKKKEEAMIGALSLVGKSMLQILRIFDFQIFRLTY